jgi:pimeloyl-ACP methyl ester carboxylesterase
MTGVTVSGPVGGQPIVFLHGGVLNGVMWKPVIAHLEERYSCIAIDLPGHGARMDESFTMPSSVDATLTAIADHARGRAALVGLSLGGYVAQATAARAPGTIAGLLISGATLRYTGGAGLSTAIYGCLFPLLGRTAIKAFPQQLAKAVGTELAQEIATAGLSARAGGQGLRRLPGYDYAADLSAYPGPVIVANGVRDKKNIKHQPLFLQHVPSAQVINIEDAGHACALTQPRAFAAVVDTLLDRIRNALPAGTATSDHHAIPHRSRDPEK